jgi:hypothetical protein
VVFHRTVTNRIIAARNDGSHAHTIARGPFALLAPRGGLVAVAGKRGSSGFPELRLASVHGGVRRRLMRDAVGPAWSPDGRRLVAGDGANGDGFLFDLARHRRRDLNLFTFSGGASFSPDGRHVAIAVTPELDDRTEVRIYGAGIDDRNHSRWFAQGTDPLWGRGGIAFLGPNGALRLKPKSGAKSRPLAQQNLSGLHPTGWSKNGGRLLFEEDVVRGPILARIISPSTGRVVTLPQDFDEVDALSRDGRHVLGVVDGNVVSVTGTGRATVIARHANSPSWDR